MPWDPVGRAGNCCREKWSIFFCSSVSVLWMERWSLCQSKRQGTNWTGCLSQGYYIDRQSFGQLWLNNLPKNNLQDVEGSQSTQRKPWEKNTNSTQNSLRLDLNPVVTTTPCTNPNPNGFLRKTCSYCLETQKNSGRLLISVLVTLRGITPSYEKCHVRII